MKTCPVCDTPYPNQHSTCPTDGAVLIESRELAPGYIVRSKYRIERKLGQGGMGTVYLAEHMMLGGQMALKFLAVELSRNPRFVKRFRNEARTTYQLRHPNIVEVNDLDQDENGSLFIAMEYIAGPSLRLMLRQMKGPLPVPHALQIAQGIAAGLAAAHARGAVHRDIKPENILLAAEPNGGARAKILDFGIAAMTDNITDLSRTHGLLLTPEYAAPEQWRGTPANQLDGRTDLYALGGILYEMLAGKTPFRAENPEGWMYQHLQGVPEPISALRPELAVEYPGLEQLVMSLLAKDRDNRLPSAEAFLEMLPHAPVSQSAEQSEGGHPLEATGAFPRRATSENLRMATTGSPASVNLSSSLQTPTPVEAPQTESISSQVDTSGMFTIPTPEGRKFNWRIIGLVAGGIAVALVATLLLLRSTPKHTGSNPSTSSPPAQAAISIVADPLISPPSGKYGGKQTVTILDSTPNAEIHFTLDGTAPSKASTIYTQPLSNLPRKTTIEAIAIADGMSPSNVVVNTYSFGGNAPQQPKDAAFQQGKSSYDHHQYRAARAQFSSSCQSGNISACNYLGYLLAQGLGGARNMDKARTVYGNACAKGNADSCASLGVIYRDAGDIKNAENYFKKACDGGLAEGCKLLRSLR